MIPPCAFVCLITMRLCVELALQRNWGVSFSSYFTSTCGALLAAFIHRFYLLSGRELGKVGLHGLVWMGISLRSNLYSWGHGTGSPDERHHCSISAHMVRRYRSWLCMAWLHLMEHMLQGLSLHGG